MLLTDSPAVTALADALTVPDGGFTVSLPEGGRPRTGFVVSIFPDREVKIDSPVSAADLVAYVNDHADILRQGWTLFGGWHDPESGTIFLDVCVWEITRERAESLARSHGQLAYFDVTAGRSVAVSPITVL